MQKEELVDLKTLLGGKGILSEFESEDLVINSNGVEIKVAYIYGEWIYVIYCKTPLNKFCVFAEYTTSAADIISKTIKYSGEK